LTPLFYDFLTTLHGMIVYGMIVHGVFIHGMIYTGMDIVRLVRHLLGDSNHSVGFSTETWNLGLDWTGLWVLVICKSLLSKTQLKI